MSGVQGARATTFSPVRRIVPRRAGKKAKKGEASVEQQAANAVDAEQGGEDSSDLLTEQEEGAAPASVLSPGAALAAGSASPEAEACAGNLALADFSGTPITPGAAAEAEVAELKAQVSRARVHACVHMAGGEAWRARPASGGCSAATVRLGLPCDPPAGAAADCGSAARRGALRGGGGRSSRRGGRGDGSGVTRSRGWRQTCAWRAPPLARVRL